MFFSDEIFLVKEIMKKDEIKQYIPQLVEEAVWSDLTSVSSSETSAAGQNGHKAEARAIVHIEDYKGQSIVRCPEGTPLITAGYYDVYRKYFLGDTVELYLKEKDGIINED